MKKYTRTLLVGLVLFATGAVFAQNNTPCFPPDYKVDTRIDNMLYWQQCARAGLVPVEPVRTIPPARFTGSKVLLRGVRAVDSPDVLVTNEPSNSTQSENSIVVNPNNGMMLLNSNNSTPQPSTGSVKGADALKSLDAGETWSGTVEGAGGSNSGDPAAVIDLNGRWFVGYIDNAYGQSVSYSDNQGATWSVAKVGNGTILNMLDKNHLWVDISPTSPYKGYLYDGWMVSNNISISRSVNSGAAWSTPVAISAGTAAGSHNQGINFKCGPDGEVYAAWAVYDNWPGDEKAVGFSKSLDGGNTWSTAFRAINNLKGIRTTGVTQNMRVNSFPSMAVDLSNSPYRGTIYIVWTNIGYPGVNSGTGSSVYMIKSTDKGATWSSAKRINSDSTAGKQHYLPWITCDQATGQVSVVFYDNRNCASTEAEAWMAYSTDGGSTFTDLKVSDVTFTPSPIPNMASKYMGDYLAISAYGGKAFPCWTDTRSGHCLSYVSPIEIIIPQATIEYTENVLNDTTFGNGNTVMDYGETDLIGLKMTNTGNAEAEDVQVTLTCDNPYITLLDSTETYGHFDVDQTKFIADGYKFKVSDSIPNNEAVIFTVKAVDAQDSVTYSTFQLIAHAPDVSILSLSIDDIPPGGNNNGRLDPGEEATLMITTKNNGLWDAEQVASSITSLNPYLTVLTPTFPIGTLHAGETVLAAFPVKVSSSAAIGSAAQIYNVAVSRYRATEKTFNVKIGLIVEDWETGNFSKFPWQFTNSTKPWTIDPNIKYEKLYAARSGVITDNETTGIFLNYNVSMDDSISFFRRVSSQPLRDALKFYIDDAMVGMWSNNVDTSFRYNSFPVTAGPHTFKWVYEKNGTITMGQDAAWTDFIVLPPQYLTTASAGGNADVCAGNSYQLYGMADSYDSLRWTTSGTGTFNNPFILDPLYTPSTQDINDGMVWLKLTAYGQFGTDTNSMMLMIYTAPTVDAGTDLAVCSGTSKTIMGATSTAYNSLHWGTRGDGQFDNPMVLTPTYTPGPQDISKGTVTLLLYAIGSMACPVASDSLVLTVHPLPQVNLGKDTVACAGAHVLFDATHPNASAYLWQPSGKTTPAITVDSAGIGIHSQQITVAVTDQNGCTGTDAATITFKDCSGIQDLPGVKIHVYPNPSDGLFTVEITSAKPQRLDLTLLTNTGSVGYRRTAMEVSTSATEKVDVRSLPAGSYILQVANGEGKVTMKVTVMK
ncbi:MAG TPA: T9SS type A sorting domain-containing protein [Bacteroidales bacterium]|nr:T9SS type A sorting domain-containing protein [Bacteroidales bacterium]